MKRIFLILTVILLGITTQAQVGVQSQSNHGKIRTGGGIGINFGNNSYVGFNISPFIGYAITPQLEGGLTAGYQYGNSDLSRQNLFSVGPYLNYYIIESFFARTHFEYYSGNQTIKYNSGDIKNDFDENALWIGGGYQSTGRIRYQIGMMYNVLYDENESIFSNAFRPFGGIVVAL